MEAIAKRDGPTTGTTSPPCAMAIAPGKKSASRMRKMASGCVFWIGMVLICVVAVPAGILLCTIYLIMRAMNFLIDRIEIE